MAVRIRVRDFQSIEDAEITVEGFTAITGTNNTGKTAVMRAVQGAFTNPPGDVYVRHGAERFIVDIDFMDGHTLRWEKGPKIKPTYTVDGKVMNPGRAVPEEALSLGVRPIRAGSEKDNVWPQIAPQMTGQVFLLDLPGSALAEAVADVERVGRLTQALRLAETDKRAASSTLRVRQKDAERLREDVSAYAGLDAVAVVVAGVEDSLVRTRKEASHLDEVHGLATRLAVVGRSVAALEGIEDVGVPPKGQADEARVVGVELASVRGLRQRLKAANGVVAAVGGITSVSIPPPPSEAARVRSELRDLRVMASALAAARATKAKAEAAHAASAAVNLTEIDAHIRKGRKAVQTSGWMPAMATKIREARDEVRALGERLTKKQEEAKRSVAVVREILDGLGECPVCGATVEAG